MCFGGKSVDAYYEEIKPEKQELPDLAVDKASRGKPKYESYTRGAQARSLLNMEGM